MSINVIHSSSGTQRAVQELPELLSDYDVTFTKADSAMDFPYLAAWSVEEGTFDAIVVLGSTSSDQLLATIAAPIYKLGMESGIPVLVAIGTGHSAVPPAAPLATRIINVMGAMPTSPSGILVADADLRIVGRAIHLHRPSTSRAAASGEAVPGAADETVEMRDIELEEKSEPAAAVVVISEGEGAGCGSGSGEAESAEAPAEAPLEGAELAAMVAQLKVQLLAHGGRGIVSLGRKFRIMDDDGSGTLNLEEFLKGMHETEMSYDDAQLVSLFKHFDDDNSGNISFDELLVAVRGELNPRRLELVNKAFKVLDVTKDGKIDLTDIMRRYDASKHPDVISGKRTSAEVLREFLDVFDAGEKDGLVTPQEFQRYYATVSASIDDDDYFELMIRNAWHISGGEGWCENTTCRRVLVTHRDGRQTVEEVQNDMDIGDSREKIKAQLIKQGIDDIVAVEFRGSLDTTTPPTATRAQAAPKTPAAAKVPAVSSPTRRRHRATESSIVFG